VKGALAVARILKSEETNYLFCFPNNDLIDAVSLAGIKPIMVRTERTAVGMADAYSRINNGRRLGICAFQNGPGIENAFGGVAQAFSDSTPILVCARGEPQRRIAALPNFDAVRNYERVTKWSARVAHADMIPDYLRRAFTYLRAGRPGPVLLEFPQEVFASEVDEKGLDYSPVKGVRSMADPAAVDAAARALVKAARPLIHAGQGVLYAEATPELVDLAELLDAPVMTTLPGKSAFPEDHPLALGCGGRTGPLAAARFLAECDLVFAAGASLSISGFAAPIPAGKVAVQLTVDERDLNKEYPVQHLLMGDAKLVLGQLLEAVRSLLGPDGRRGGGGDTALRVKAVREQWIAEWMPRLTSEEVPLNPYRVIWELQQVLDLDNTVATHDAGSPRDQMAPFWKALKPRSYIGWGKSTHLGYGLALAMGAKVAMPDKTVLNIMGDAAFGMIGMDVETAVRNRIGTLTVILNNSCLGGYDKYLHNATEIYGTRYLSGDYAKVAEGLGAHAERVERPSEIAPAVKRALAETARGRPAVLEMVTVEDNKASRYWVG
jgi:acetolactate synthase-1/2/3 large subunit